MNNVITASRMNSLMACPRQHFWSYEVGLTKEDSAHALRFGSAWHRAIEARWNGLTYEEALVMAIPEGIDLDEFSCATLAALLAGYYDHYGSRENVGKSEPEQQFDFSIEGTHFTMQGKIDNIGLMRNQTHALIESKTTSDQLNSDSDYWLRLAFNLQVFQYFDAACQLGYDISTVYYDVCRKPSIRPLKSVNELDEQGRKIIVDPNGKRVFKTKKVKVKVGKGKKAKLETKEVEDLESPIQSANKENGWTIKQAPETADQFSERLWKDTLERSDFYFCRREIPILEDDLRQFYTQRLSLVKLIEHYRSEENSEARDPEAWPRHVSTDTCNFCRYKSFCLSNLTVDINNPPQGFSIKPFNPELSYATTTETDSSDASGTAS